MRIISETMASALAQGAAKLCHVWLIERRDGLTLGFTDHDRALVFLGVVCQAQSGLTAGATNADIGETGSAAISGAISSEAISAEDIAAGLYDSAAVRIYTVDWRDPSDYVLTGAGTLARLECRGGVVEGGSFIAHIEGPAAQLDRVIGRRFGFLCDAALGDARCGLTGTLAAASCDKRYSTCLNIFDNVLNFRGFPDLPGEDFLTIYPRGGDVMDGGSRQQSAGR
ncbi:DUF2163 domain-containing protein [Asticcacaulis taihuensis]|uniref:Bacteriophage phiJL001 Gp84 C-terminal domain-containing protein n=1 Tax=Asticcacaulis taihuensis TaxID=260084 RepID=A0A1G4R9W9_9CAUL|nr:DUF2163 domain-containing protein [Asticcacaulis taihuensis]SCW53672.1 phage conserved hypothetical protein BR0599 [Asticcacaulis taihuensis]